MMLQPRWRAGLRTAPGAPLPLLRRRRWPGELAVHPLAPWHQAKGGSQSGPHA